MSVTRLVILRCDGPLASADDGCEVEPGGVPLALADLPATVAEARRVARRAGWSQRRDGSDLCPACQEASR